LRPDQNADHEPPFSWDREEDGEISKSESTEADPGTNWQQGHFDSELISLINLERQPQRQSQQQMDVTINYLDLVRALKLPEVVATPGNVADTLVKPRPSVTPQEPMECP
jgi:hypothetical protein